MYQKLFKIHENVSENTLCFEMVVCLVNLFNILKWAMVERWFMETVSLPDKFLQGSHGDMCQYILISVMKITENWPKLEYF